MTPLTPATFVRNAEGVPYSREYDDIYASAAGAAGQAAHVFIDGNGLPGRWQRRGFFTVMETGFGAGVNFLHTWARWRADPLRCARLHVVSVEKHPFELASLRAYHAPCTDPRLRACIDLLCAAWPPLVPGLHRLEFDGGRVVLTLGLGDVAALLPHLSLRADAFYLDGFAPAKNADMWTAAVFKRLARLAAPDATLATYTSVGTVRRGLQATGFAVERAPGFGGKRHMLVGRFAPRWRVRRYEPPAPDRWPERHALVIGAGLAGCAVVERLAARGWRVTLLERGDAPAGGASGNPAGVFHPLISHDDSVAARWLRTAFLYALHRWRELERAGHPFSWRAEGLLQAVDGAAGATLRAALAGLRLPPELAAWTSPTQAGALGGIALPGGALFYPEGGWVDPAALCRAQLAAAGAALTTRYGVEVAGLVAHGEGWLAVDRAGAPLARAPVVILANAGDAARLAPAADLPTLAVRGQLTVLPQRTLPGLRLPVIGDGYVVPLADGRRLTGATYDVGDPDPWPRLTSQTENLQRLARLTPDFVAPGDPGVSGVSSRPSVPDVPGDPSDPSNPLDLPARVAFRCVTSDRMPLLGALADTAEARARAATLHGAHLRDLPRQRGLYAALAYGSRGLLWAPLGAELLVSQLEGEPLPLMQGLVDAVDPARFLLRDLRRVPGTGNATDAGPTRQPVHNQG